MAPPQHAESGVLGTPLKPCPDDHLPRLIIQHSVSSPEKPLGSVFHFPLDFLCFSRCKDKIDLIGADALEALHFLASNLRARAHGDSEVILA